MNRKIILFVALGLIASLIYIFFVPSNDEARLRNIYVKAEQGEFEKIITVSGEIQAMESVKIQIPSALTHGRARVYDIKITDMIEEGTVVDSGDYVASLDHSAIMEMINEREEGLEKQLDALDDAKMDTSLTLTNARNGLLTDLESVEEKELVLSQSVYESPAIQRQAQMDLEKAKRNLKQNKRSYELQKRKAVQQVKGLQNEIKKIKEYVKELEHIFESLEIKAPKKGMVIYMKDNTGSKLKVGSMVSRWRPQIAELPDLSNLLSKTYVNEVDVSDIKEGNDVKIGIDAFPDKSFVGKVVSVSNIGQTLPEKNTKVFEVQIKLNGTDSKLKPSMTTSNQISAAAFDDATYIPLEAVFSNDTLSWVYFSDEKEKRILKLGEENENFVVVKEGLVQGDELLLNPGAEEQDWEWSGLDIYEAIQAEISKEMAANDTIVSEK